MSDLIERAGAWLSAFHNKGGVIVPEDSYLALIRDLAAKLTRCEGLLREARLDWIKVGYGASHEDVAECRDFCDRIDALLNEQEPRT